MNPTLVALAAAAVLTLAACGSSNSSSSTSAGDASPADASTSTTSTSAGSGAGLGTASSSLGTIVVDGQGRTVYVYDKDTQGAKSSACTGSCSATWPEVPAGGALNGVTGKVGSISGVDGKAQATLDGWPLYYFAQDGAAGDVNGQGLGGIWWVVNPDGSKVTGSTPSTAGGGHGGY